MRKGAIILVPFPFTDLSGRKIRPALVLAVSHGEDCTLAVISSVQSKRSPFDVVAKASDTNGLKVDSIIKTDKIATLQKGIVMGAIGRLEPSILVEVDKKLKKLFRV